ncbi:MAG: co-chaperone YbbN [Alphaproteobacteria bacterium]|nr:co-chaperone YbbN [Alphaproteobacteria bacterium]
MALIGPGGRPIQKPGAAPAEAAGAHIKAGSLETFTADVLQASREVPVLVYFWSPRSANCKEFEPLLDRVVTGAKGAVRLVKVNIDVEHEIAQQLRIQTVPTVYAFQNGQPVDGFMNAISESQLRAFIDQMTGGHGGADHAAEVLAAADEAFAAGDIAMAAQAFGHVLQDEPGHPKAVAGLARCYLKSGDIERARNTLQLVRPDGAGDEAIRAVEAELQLADNASKVAGDEAPLRARLEADPKDHQARYDLALALDARGDREGALDELLELVRRDRKWNDEAARKHLVTLFEAMGPADERTLAARRKLSSILFS